jgi:Ca-activated chloride channel family protein
MRGVARSAWFVLVLATLITLAACASGSSTPPQDFGTPPPTPPSVVSHTPCAAHSNTPVALTMYYGSEKQAWMQDVVSNFNSRHYRACDGPISVRAIPIGSGDSMEQILAGKIKPDVWSPAGSVWITLLNDAWRGKTGKDFVGSGATDALSLVTSPVVIAMWKPLAQALGWPKKPIGWSDVAALSANPQGWGAYGHPEYGTFKFGHTHPDTSNSGLDSVISEYYAAAGKTRDLTTADITNSQARAFIAKIESSVIHYGDSTGFFADEMFNRGPSFLSAAVMYESLVVESYDTAQFPKAKSFPPVVAIYPKEGTFLSDHPYTIPQAPWVSAAKRTSAELFADYLLDKPQQAKALRYGFRPAMTKPVPLAAPIDAAHGVDPQQPASLLQIPGAQLIRQIKSGWDEQRRKVSVMLVLDRSGSMNDTINGKSKIAGARDGAKAFISLLGDADEVGLTVFSSDAQVLAPVAPLGSQRAQLNQLIDGIQADGSTRLYDTVAEQVDSLKASASTGTNIKAVVVLTDGLDTASHLTVADLSGRLSANGTNAGNGLKVFSIAYGSDADKDGLTKLSQASGGEEFDGNPDNIRLVFLAISRFF